MVVIPEQAPLVLGPAGGGGYYFIGLTGVPPKLFEGILGALTVFSG